MSNPTSSSSQQAWTKTYNMTRGSYPAEYVIRMFKGTYPKLSLKEQGYLGTTIADIGCGEGRHCTFLADQGFSKVIGVEISEEIVTKNNSEVTDDRIEFRLGSNSKIPVPDMALDWLLSWNACYYLDADQNFDSHVEEFARCLRPGGNLVFSIPQATCFIYQNATEIKPGYYRINSDPFNVRNGEVLRMFASAEEIEQTFSSYFTDFIFGRVTDDCFGYAYHWHIGTARRNDISLA